jgi:hypothetical protein
VSAPQWAQTAPPQPQWGQAQPAPGYYAPAARARAGAGGTGALLALAGGAVAVGSAWLPWMTLGSEWFRGIDLTSADGGLANGYYLVAAGALAAACGLIMVLGMATSPGARQLLAIGAIAGGIGACAVEAAAYMKVNDSLNLASSIGASGGAVGMAMGWGIYVGVAGGAVAVLGGLMGLRAGPRVATAGAGPQPNLLIGLAAIAAIVVGVVIAWPQIQKQIDGNNGGNATPPIVFVTPSGGHATAAPTNKATAAPTAGTSFMTRGYATAEQAMNQWVTDQGYTYGGDCADASGTDYCSSMVDELENATVYAVGGLNSEAEMWVLVQFSGGKWYVADVASASAPPPWH